MSLISWQKVKPNALHLDRGFEVTSWILSNVPRQPDSSLWMVRPKIGGNRCPNFYEFPNT